MPIWNCSFITSLLPSFVIVYRALKRSVVIRDFSILFLRNGLLSHHLSYSIFSFVAYIFVEHSSDCENRSKHIQSYTSEREFFKFLSFFHPKQNNISVGSPSSHPQMSLSHPLHLFKKKPSRKIPILSYKLLI